MGRRHFNREFKLEAVKLVKERGVSVSQAARDLGIGASVVGRWVREIQADKTHAFPGSRSNNNCCGQNITGLARFCK
jgi:transposase